MPFPADAGLVLHEDFLTVGTAADFVILELVPEEGKGVRRELGPPVEAHMAEE